MRKLRSKIQNVVLGNTIKMQLPKDEHILYEGSVYYYELSNSIMFARHTVMGITSERIIFKSSGRNNVIEILFSDIQSVQLERVGGELSHNPLMTINIRINDEKIHSIYSKTKNNLDTKQIYQKVKEIYNVCKKE